MRSKKTAFVLGSGKMHHMRIMASKSSAYLTGVSEGLDREEERPRRLPAKFGPKIQPLHRPWYISSLCGSCHLAACEGLSYRGPQSKAIDLIIII